ncbi:hypothetical protein SYNPS1DRAFT_28385 [Syncephalis pseudoplumigaleata]|uniref:SCP domain-containing protein n=1 Tax=Syncephalis pseudoplumigaleata TaxID=1712513 RepID=A0A4P9Z0U3_9FUNG|nr:hypothetical protein SYNPS1DRAFT_28385 [Syncephalis pseudoplumigaleata]|eukprot:RKP25895.1 hypothetical protein SYNPS1DRAFT_28385 [Syncephalis pseudoplumigaleata]
MSRMLQLVNEERARHDKPALLWDTYLAKAARAHSDAQASANKMGHQMAGEADLRARVKDVSPEGHWTTWAENVGAGSASEETMMRSWINSPSHHKNILGAHTHFAAEMATSAQGKVFWTQVFANDGTVCPEDGKPLKGHQHSQPAHQTTKHASIERMLQLVNEERARHGLRALHVDACLVRAAQAHSDRQGQAATMTHRLPGEPDLITRVTEASDGKLWVGWAENVGFGSRKEDVMMENWMNSPSHRENILEDYTHFGAAMSIGVDNKPYWTQVFANDGSAQAAEDSLPSPPLSPLPHEEAPAEEQLQAVLALVNEERAKAKLAPLALDACLTRAAQLHSEAQACAGKMSHQLPDEADLVARVNAVTAAGKQWAAWAENVAFGNDNERVVMSMWMNSPQHRGNILGRYSHLGIGIAHRDGKPYWTQVFGTRSEPAHKDSAAVETVIKYVSTGSRHRPSHSATLTPSGMAAKMNAVLELVNSERTKHGKGKLVYDARLAQAAHDHCMEQACAGQMSHQLPGEPDLVTRIDAVSKGRRWLAWAENVGFGSADEKVIMDVWLKSAQHRNNILGDYTHFGVAMANDASGKPYWTQLFAQLDDPAARPSGDSNDNGEYSDEFYVTTVTTTTAAANTTTSSSTVRSPSHQHSKRGSRIVTHTVERIDSTGGAASHCSSAASSVASSPSPITPVAEHVSEARKPSSNPLKRLSLKMARGSIKSSSSSTNSSTITTAGKPASSPKQPAVKQLFKSIFGSISSSDRR